MIAFQISGVEQICRQLDTAVDMRLTERAVKEACSYVQSAAKLKAHVNSGELREKILTDVHTKGHEVHGEVYTNVPQGIYQEFGTGPKGEANHANISPNAAPVYVQEPWWVHESQVNRADAERYHWFSIETEDGIFYQINGQAADPFLYPALKDNEKEVVEIISKRIKEELRRL